MSVNRVKLIASLIKSGNVQTARCEAIGLRSVSGLEYRILRNACVEANEKYGCKLTAIEFIEGWGD